MEIDYKLSITLRLDTYNITILLRQIEFFSLQLANFKCHPARLLMKPNMKHCFIHKLFRFFKKYFILQ